MSVKLIQPTDTLETGFRSKYNETAAEIIVDYAWPDASGSQTFLKGDILQLEKYGGGFINITLADYYVNKADLSTQLQNVIGIPYRGDWLNGAYSVPVTVSYNGTIWRSTVATTGTDEPGVSLKWINVLTPSLYVWDDTRIYAKDNTVRYTISGVNYQFYSLIDDNGSEPALVSTDWAALGSSASSYTPPPPIITNIPAGTSLTNQVYYNIPFDTAVYGDYPTVIIGLTEVGGVQPVTVEAPVKYQYFHGNILVYLPNDGSGITLDPYKVIIKA